LSLPSFQIPGLGLVPFPAARFRLGAEGGCDVHLIDAGEAQVLVFERGGRWHIKQLAGVGPLLVNGIETREAPLFDHSRIRVGGVTVEMIQTAGPEALNSARPMQDATFVSMLQSVEAEPSQTIPENDTPTAVPLLTPPLQTPLSVAKTMTSTVAEFAASNPASQRRNPEQSQLTHFFRPKPESDVADKPEPQTLLMSAEASAALFREANIAPRTEVITQPDNKAVPPKPQPRDELAPGSVVDGRYEIIRLLAKGGMGEVYIATHQALGRKVALKVLLKEFSTDEALVKRFQSEAIALGGVGHEHIVSVLDSGQMPSGRFYFVMEFVDGQTLKSLVAREGPVTWRRAASMVSQIAKALGAAHDKQVIHRDVKPDNIMVLSRTSRDFVKVLDFGVAKQFKAVNLHQTAIGQVFGSPRYMSPESVAGKVLDHRTDIYSLGLILYELIVGKPACGGESLAETMAQQMFVTPPDMHSPHGPLPVQLQQLASHMLQKEVCARVTHMREVFETLDALLFVPRPSSPLPQTPAAVIETPPQPRSTSRSSALLFGVLLALGLAGLMGAMVMAFTSRGPDATAPEPNRQATESETRKNPTPSLAPQPQFAATPSTIAETVALRVETMPSKAEVYEGDILLGNTPLTLTRKNASSTALMFKLKGFEPLERTVQFESAGTVEFYLAKQVGAAIPKTVKPKAKVVPDAPPIKESPF
jgi:eukaryotic-like serine/threonine-protein kinase